MGGNYVLAVMVGVAILLEAVQCDVSCKGADGHPGDSGTSGRDGLRGAKGEKGEPATMAAGPVDLDVLLRLKGETGSRGVQGPIGPKGFRGDLGAAGSPGLPGPPGPDGKGIGQGQHASHQDAHSAFSVIRTERRYPPYSQIVTYQETVVNINNDVSTATGIFTCRISGTYYFNFQSMAKVSMCLYIAYDDSTDPPQQKKLGFCDYNSKSSQNIGQVLTGGVVLNLAPGQRVWLESFRDQQGDNDLRDGNEKKIIFNGFLLFPNPV
ncbi:complement C1q subcomponent subunit A [Archocentrus centrarchus]|uniref:complement C1q subcomponent subunit A n=1 Tax=Archocentrus centrarchus TaxID=63155 RepID=UPI0011E9BD6E|nr:complement C1q subcomponent subunit A-like [Archocentrus centrarchus]